ncbi:putative PurR-regulated permease PerM [Peribacillus deserti]|uniref:PurR-regulated permease PerM n=1 Tax=Peribacillus deserti TaxID=673318 RepID=A0ABS2QL40_9BACI|nr:AI-2E family transporter [Peribacillus deserti]MBM7693886.1 putative PurR-regulated permease PerM [Peribacillus deserti]
MWINKPFFKYATGIILCLIIILLFGRIGYFMKPIQQFIATIFFPILISGLLYYLLRPVVRLLSKFLPKTVSILTVYAFIFGTIFAIFHFFGPSIADQVKNLSDTLPQKVKEISSQSEKAISKHDFGLIEGGNLQEKAVNYFRSFSQSASQNIIKLFATLTSIATVLVVVPFIVFYFLKDDDKLRPFLLKYIPSDHEPEGNKILMDMDKALSTYITGQFIIAAVDGALMFIGYMIIGIDYALVLAVFAMFLTIVPFAGPLLGIIPALFVALQNDPFMAVKVLIVLVIVQQLEGHLVTPNVMGKKLNIHPLTIILLLLVAGSIYGFVGILIAIPLYSVIKTLVKNFRLFYRLRRRKTAVISNSSDSSSTNPRNS